MRLWIAAALSMATLVACTYGEPRPGTTAKSSPEATVGTDTRRGETSSPEAGASTALVRADLRCFNHRVTSRGTNGDDRIRGTPASDVIVTGAGDDVVKGLTMMDVVCTGPGNDRVVDAQGSVHDHIMVRLGRGDDRFVLRTRTGVRGGGHIGTIRAGAGNDILIMARGTSMFVVPGGGADRVRAVAVPRRAFATPCVRFGSAPGAVRVNLRTGHATGQGQDRLVNIRCVFGSAFNDVIVGTDRDDEISPGGGLNRVYAAAGDDFVNGGVRAEEIYLGAGEDTAYAGGGWDRAYGGPGDDLLAGYSEGDYLDGGPGDDYLFADYPCERNTGPDTFSRDDDPNELFGRSGNDGLSGAQGNDRLDGGPGIDAGQGGYRDGRIDWVTSVEIFNECASPYTHG